MMEDSEPEYANMLFKALPEEFDVREALVGTCLLLSWLIRAATDVRTTRAPTHHELALMSDLAESCFRGIRASIAHTPERQH